MQLSLPEITRQLANAGVFSPGSEQLNLYETRLTRFFEREYARCKRSGSSLSDLGLSSSRGAVMEETGSLMDEHYDKTCEFFTSFLDSQYRAYSMAYYGSTADAVRGISITLEQAQHAKFELIAARAQLSGNERIFNIGCGFGSLETFLLTKYPGIEITGITPSRVQVNYLRERMRDFDDPLGGGRFRLIEGRFDQMSASELGASSYDVVMSVGVLEHVLNLKSLLQIIAGMLVPRGRTFHHFITSRSVVPQFLDPSKTRIGAYFPGGRVWPHDEFLRHAGHFELVGNWFINGLNYWRTLDEWHRRYWEHIDKLYGKVFDVKGIAHWNEYFSLCKAMFAPMDGEFYGNSHYLFRAKT